MQPDVVMAGDLREVVVREHAGGVVHVGRADLVVELCEEGLALRPGSQLEIAAERAGVAQPAVPAAVDGGGPEVWETDGRDPRVRQGEHTRDDEQIPRGSAAVDAGG